MTLGLAVMTVPNERAPRGVCPAYWSSVWPPGCSVLVMLSIGAKIDFGAPKPPPPPDGTESQ